MTDGVPAAQMMQQPTPQPPSEEPIGGFRQPRQRHRKTINNIKLETLSIEDALKNEIEYMPMKTPISILQELLSRRGITPNYELVQIEGAVHEPTFRYRVSFNDKDAMGAGRSKKEAKHAAAKNLIDKLTGVPISDNLLGVTNGVGAISLEYVLKRKCLNVFTNFSPLFLTEAASSVILLMTKD
jgi:RISC-loading complex subunit TARBP2